MIVEAAEEKLAGRIFDPSPILNRVKRKKFEQLKHSFTINSAEVNELLCTEAI